MSRVQRHRRRPRLAVGTLPCGKCWNWWGGEIYSSGNQSRTRRDTRSVHRGSDSSSAATFSFCAFSDFFLSQDFLWDAKPSDLKNFPQWGHWTCGAMQGRGGASRLPSPGELLSIRIKLESPGVKNSSHDVMKIPRQIINDLRDSTTNQHGIYKRFVCNFSQAQS